MKKKGCYSSALLVFPLMVEQVSVGWETSLSPLLLWVLFFFESATGPPDRNQNHSGPLIFLGLMIGENFRFYDCKFSEFFGGIYFSKRYSDHTFLFFEEIFFFYFSKRYFERVLRYRCCG